MIEALLTSLLAGALLALPGAVPAGAIAAAADSLPAPVRTLAPVEVAAARARLDARRRMPTASVTDLPAHAQNRALESVGELLQTSVGARVVSYGGLGALSTLSLRGAAPGQVSVLLDGVPLATTLRGVVNLADLPVAAIERIEVYRGGGPHAFGAATPGGAVNLVSLDAARVRSARFAAGSFGTVTASGTAAAPWRGVSWLASAGYEGSRGDFAFHNDNETVFNPDDDVEATRINNRFDATHVLARLAAGGPAAANVVVRGEHFHKAQGVPGMGAVQAPHPRLTLDRALMALEAKLPPHASMPGVTLRADLDRERQHFRDPEGELRLGRQDAVTHVERRGFGLDVHSPAAWSGLSADAGADARAERAQGAPPTLGQPTPPVSRRDVEGAYATVRLHARREALVVQASRRWDRQHDDIRATLVGAARYAASARRVLDSPQLGACLRLPAGLESRANWSRSARPPEFGELFGDQGLVAANPKLKPERGEQWDASLAWSGRGRAWTAALSAAHFASQQRDLIGWVPAPGRTVRATNFSRARIEGDELEARASWGPLAAAGSLAWTSARQSDAGNIYDGRRLPLRPERLAYARLDARAGAWRLAADVLDLGEDFYDPANRQRLAPRTLAGAALARSWRAITVTLECKNAGDRRVSDAVGFPIPGRAFFLACEWPGRPASGRAS